jgi:acyl-CoA synthetase (AMP-forming)/AMP-acid ligase II
MAASSPDLLEVFDRWRTAKPEHVVHTWLRSDGSVKDEYTLQALHDAAGAVASQLQGVDVAILCYPPGLEFLVAFYGCLFAGAAAAPCYPPDPRNSEARTARHFESIVRASGASVVLTSTAYLRGRKLLREDTLNARWLATDSINSAPVEPVRPPPALAFLQYTSGSTSTPKGVMIGRSNLAHNLLIITKALASDEATVCVSWLPQYHDMGLVGSLLGTLYCGGRGYHSSPLDFVREPTSWLRNLTDRRATHTQAPSFAFGLAARKFLSSPCHIKVDLSSLVHATNGAEPIRAADVDAFCSAFAAHGLRAEAVVATYGLAEHTVFVCRSSTPKRREFDAASLACDRIVPGKGTVLFGCGSSEDVELAVVRENKRVSRGVGEIWVRSQSRARGYWRSPQSSAAAFGGFLEGDDPVAIDEDGAVSCEGWLRTGDLGFLDSEGDLFVCGRSKDLLIVRGKNHYPQDLEATWERAARATFRPGCSAVVPLGKDRIQIICEARKNCPDLADACAVALSAVQRAHGIAIGKATVVSQRELIKTSSGKVARRACRDALEQGVLKVLYASEVNEQRNACEKALTSEERSQLRAKLDAASDDDVLRTCQTIAAKVAKVESMASNEPLTTLGPGPCGINQ